MEEMMIKVETISQEIIRPSSPTPNSFKLFKLSILDQLYTTFYIPIIFFYPSTTNIHSKLATIKSSLSKVLTQFYPLAGRIKDSTTIDCNDEGALFIHSKVASSMSCFLKPPKIDLLDKLVPCRPTCNKPVEKAEQLIVRANAFECGGFALGICFLHQIIDGTTFTTFMKQWAQLSRENHDQENSPLFLHNLGSSVFPPNHILSSKFAVFKPIAPNSGEKISIKRFVFNSDSISSLKSITTSKSLQNPTRADVIAGFLWKCMNRCSDSESSSALAVIVNLRPRLNPPLPDYSIGNLIWFAVSNEEKNRDHELSYFVSSVRRSVNRSIDPEFLEGLQGVEGFEMICKLQEEEKEIYAKSTDGYAVSSLSRMGFYEADFGWGKPLWVSFAPSITDLVVNVSFLMEINGSDGIEAWVTLEEKKMRKLEEDLLFQAYTKSNPDVIS